MKTNKIFGIIICAWLCGLVCCQLCSPVSDKTIPASFPEPAHQKQAIQKEEKQSRKKQDSLQQEADQLIKEKKKLSQSLQQYKKKNRELKTKLQKAIVSVKVDSGIISAPCDTLIITATEYIRSTDETDSLYKGIIAKQEKEINNRDSMIVLKNEQYISLKQHLNSAIAGEEQLLGQVKKLSKKLGRKKRNNRILLAGCLVLAAVLVSK